jgi:hypothetical protein
MQLLLFAETKVHCKQFISVVQFWQIPPDVKAVPFKHWLQEVAFVILLKLQTEQ